MSMLRSFLLLAPLAAASAQEPESPAPEQGPTYTGRAFLFRAQLDRARRAGWLAPALSDEEAMQRIVDALETRTRQVGKFVEAHVQAEPEERVSVTFVGHQAPSYEALLADGLGRPGRLELFAVAEPADLENAGTDLAAERARAEAWLRENPDEPAIVYRAVPREERGPHERLTWLPLRRAASDESGVELVPLLPEPILPLVRTDLESLGGGSGDEGETEGEYALVLVLEEKALGRARETLEPWEGRRLAFVLDGRVLDELELADAEAFGPAVTIDAAFTLEELRARLLSLAGGPLPAPLEFEGFGKRELPNVRRRAGGG